MRPSVGGQRLLGALEQNGVGASDQSWDKVRQSKVKNCAGTRQEVTSHSAAVMVAVPPFSDCSAGCRCCGF